MLDFELAANGNEREQAKRSWQSENRTEGKTIENKG
jgi:hypothetical protein